MRRTPASARPGGSLGSLSLLLGRLLGLMFRRLRVLFAVLCLLAPWRRHGPGRPGQDTCRNHSRSRADTGKVTATATTTLQRRGSGNGCVGNCDNNYNSQMGQANGTKQTGQGQGIGWRCCVGGIVDQFRPNQREVLIPREVANPRNPQMGPYGPARDKFVPPLPSLARNMRDKRRGVYPLVLAN